MQQIWAVIQQNGPNHLGVVVHQAGDLDDVVPLAVVGQFARAWAKEAGPWFALVLNEHGPAG